MEDMNMKANEIEEIEICDEVEETSDGFDGSSFVIGFICGIAVPGVIKGGKKLWKFIKDKRAEKKLAEAGSQAQSKIIEIDADEEDSDAEMSEE